VLFYQFHTRQNQHRKSQQEYAEWLADVKSVGDKPNGQFLGLIVMSH
jgi:hypothetical protein